MSGAASRRGPVGVAVIGAGVISKQYLDNLTVFPDLKVQSVARDELMPFRGTLKIDKAVRLLEYAPTHPLEVGLVAFRRLQLA